MSCEGLFRKSIQNSSEFTETQLHVQSKMGSMVPGHQDTGVLFLIFWWEFFFFHKKMKKNIVFSLISLSFSFSLSFSLYTHFGFFEFNQFHQTHLGSVSSSAQSVRSRDMDTFHRYYLLEISISNRNQVVFYRWTLFLKQSVFVDHHVHVDFWLYFQGTFSMRTTRCW
jgi:hypothetical protein